MLKALSNERWNFTTAAHLLNRAGFGGTPEEIDRLVSLGPDGAALRLVDYERIPDSTRNPEWAKPDPQRQERLRQARNRDPQKPHQIFQEERRKQREPLIEVQ